MNDELIRQQVMHQLHGSVLLDSTEIYVSVKDEEVTLDGTVPSDGERKVAEAIAGVEEGVHEVHNYLRVSQSEHPTGQLEERF